MKCKKNLIAGLIGLVISFSSLSVSAEWVDAGYDTTTPQRYYKIQNEVLNGSYTSNFKKLPVAQEDVEWKHEGFELSYPHAGYERLYLEGNAQVISRYDGTYPQWDVRYRDFMWELYGNHRIWERQQTNIPNIGWKWDFGNVALNVPDSEVFVPTGRFEEDVTEEFVPFAIGPFDLEGNYFDSEKQAAYENMFNRFLPGDEAWKKLDPANVQAPGSLFSVESLSARDENGAYVVSDEAIANEIGTLICAKTLEGPSYHGAGRITKNVAQIYVDTYPETTYTWDWDADVVVYGKPTVEWTKPEYEMDEPYYYYQYLILNGLVFDGRNDTPRIVRYLGHPDFIPAYTPISKANPKVEWKVLFAEKDRPHNIIEAKFLDGKMAVNPDGSAFTRTSGKFANAYIKVTDNEIQLWVDGVMVETKSRVDADFGGKADGFTNGTYLVNP